MGGWGDGWVTALYELSLYNLTNLDNLVLSGTSVMDMTNVTLN